MKERLLWGTASLALALTASAALAAARITGEIVAFGETTGVRPSADIGPGPGTGLAPAQPLARVRYLDHSDVIQARLCRSFGLTVRIAGAPSDTIPSEVDVRVRHPLFTRPDGATSTEDDFPSAVVGGSSNVGFTFDNPWEMQPGAWSIAVLVDGREIAAKTFTIKAPPGGALRSGCDAVQS